MIRLIGLWFLTNLVFQISISAAHSDDVLRRKFLDVAPSQWKQYLNDLTRSTKVAIEATIVDRAADDKVLHSSYTDVILASPLWSRNVRADNAGRQGRQVSVVNSHYSFTLRGNDDLSLSDVTLGSRDEGFFSFGPQGDPTERGLALRDAARGLVIDTTWLPAMVQVPGFHVKQASHVGSSDKGLVRIDFVYPGRGGSDYLGDGSAILDSMRFWQIVSAKVEARWVDGAGEIAVENTFSDEQIDLPVVTHQLLTRRMLEGKNKVMQDTVFDLTWSQLSEKPNPTEFTLSAYGFPEPREPVGARKLLLWLNVGAVLLILSAILFRQWSKKRNEVQT